MKVLVATNHLKALGGSETFTYTLIEELVKRKDLNVEYFTFEKGLVSDKIEQKLGVNFCSKKKYDLILASHNTCVEKLYKYGFIIQTCHGIFHKMELPSKNANGYVSISLEIQNHLWNLGVPSKLINNGINLNRFHVFRKVNKELKTVLSLCQSTEANEFIENCCKNLKINFIKANKFVDSIWEMEKILNQADLVVGLGRSAYESMACGRPVIVFDKRPYFKSVGDGYVVNIVGLSLQNNCSGRYFLNEYNKDLFIGELKKYNYKDGQLLRAFSLKNLDIIDKVNEYLNFYEILKRNALNNKKKQRDLFLIKIMGEKKLKFLKYIYNVFIKLLNKN